MKILELFSGTGSVGKVARDKGWEVVSLDLNNADININILDWEYTIYNSGYFNIVWASPPCESFSAYQNAIKTKQQILDDINQRGLPLLNRTIEIINYFNPQYYFIENPQTGYMKNYIIDRPYYDVDYCKYANWGYRKRTRIWTNITEFNNLLCNKDCNNIVNNKHGSLDYIKSDSQYSRLDKRHRIPPKLIESLFDSITN
jgi:site-specific DNA-cytosine methylase